jgi:hypothetical protein
MHNTKEKRHYLFTQEDHNQADIQSYSLANTAPVSRPPANIPGFQTRSSKHYCTDILLIYPSIQPEPGFDECNLLSARLLWAKPGQWDDCLVSKIDKCWNLINRQNSTLRFWISATYF